MDNYTTRLTAHERREFAKIATAMNRKYHMNGATPAEPALGTRDERLDIIFQRHGGQTRVRLTTEERRELESYRVNA